MKEKIPSPLISVAAYLKDPGEAPAKKILEELPNLTNGKKALVGRIGSDYIAIAGSSHGNCLYRFAWEDDDFSKAKKIISMGDPDELKDIVTVVLGLL